MTEGFGCEYAASSLRKSAVVVELAAPSFELVVAQLEAL
jgi:hypothetical protein